MAHAQKPDFVFRRNGLVHLNRRGRQFSRLLAAELCASAVVMLDTPCFEVVWRVLVTHSIRQFPLHFPSRASPCAITFQLESTVSQRPDYRGPPKFAKWQGQLNWQSLLKHSIPYAVFCSLKPWKSHNSEEWISFFSVYLPGEPINLLTANAFFSKWACSSENLGDIAKRITHL